ncbi:hypothetical protein CONPUDRAFT_140757 [Coniophora puteana RWD-64-598 SS2]|uniref:ERCC4 domain-containing protein n=1 Tax=Coniophora puteana (strain RWD-64-598) TaxID=741705 RepID=A0A5M3N3J6_CONPW|nr:uncharacterized protein CONPUDRAFT_140757 [Coniophora puteana RWD-64-598 SS2]EIW85970.1 hypothetical protein CONPUDRAFT_140757 [Coniophora puteana RWD-64-598 SS2]
MDNLLPFQASILKEIHDPATSELIVLARGLGLRRILCTLMKIYDSPRSLVLLVNASPEEESAIGELLGIMGCRNPGLRIVGYEMGKRDRQDLYRKGGLISVTSRILVVDMLQSDIPTELITGIVMVHGEKVTNLSLEAFIVRLYREKNTSGFLKAFSDQPEHITSGMSPLRSIMKEMQLRKVHIYPRYHEEIKENLDQRRPDLIELATDLTEPMKDIHSAIVQCMITTLAELKRSHSTLDLDDVNIDNAHFRWFDAIVRRQLDPVWHKVGPKTKQLVGDLATLRRLLSYLVTYDALAFHAYLETLVLSNTTNASGNARQNQSPWMLTDAANIIFKTAKRRCYVLTSKHTLASQPEVIDVDDEDAWAALDEAEGFTPQIGTTNGRGTEPKRPRWLPDGIDPVLEELPKWTVLADILQEIEEEIIRQETLTNFKPPTIGSNTVLIMTSSARSAELISEFLSDMDASAPRGRMGKKMMERKLRRYLWWKGRLAADKRGSSSLENTSSQPQGRKQDNGSGQVSEALARKDKSKADRSANRRRLRGGAPTVAPTRTEATRTGTTGTGDDADTIAAFMATQTGTADADAGADIDQDLLMAQMLSQLDTEYDDVFGLVAPEQTVLVRTYADDGDEQVLAELQPRFFIMYEPSTDFLRQIEVYRNSNPGLGVRAYIMTYHNSTEEQKYLTAQRREKEAFERLIRERGSMLLPIYESRQPVGKGHAMIKTISSRAAGGRTELSTAPSQVIVDMREFRSTLPSLLHAAGQLVVPATLTVGDYILTPDICVERKSIPDLVQSFNSGRLYTQCELMSVHYKQPILLIEFEENKSFSLEAISETTKTYAKPSGKYPTKKPAAGASSAAADAGDPRVGPTIQSKLVLLTLHFPRVRIIWSSSPFATADIFADLKMNLPEPDPSKAILVGAEDQGASGSQGGQGDGVNAAAEELLQCLPGINAKNVQYVMGRVGSVRELCDMDRKDVQTLLGVEPGNACYDFMHRGERKKKAVS